MIIMIMTYLHLGAVTEEGRDGGREGGTEGGRERRGRGGLCRLTSSASGWGCGLTTLRWRVVDERVWQETGIT